MNYESELLVKKSSFYSYIFRISSKNEVKNFLEKVAKEHKKARHICHAYLFLENGTENAGFSDDGEPKNTAGRPIYELLKVKKLNNILVVTVRYFGGIKLGAGGLTRAYRESAKLSLELFIKDNTKEV
ncbi:MULTISPECIES: YigZ family protein [unclassified Mycoplasma]|uniref:IMPACT family protein n=1 Tax=unclassified Mycoplasma TaxID=2683645 RepID=UPI00211B88A3|nr:MULTISPECIES: YigZ family protein [unclassified Mycoplasma]UUM19852.1 YigZ family protein [Mycoplasma sp. 1578d]UUM24836.1 YigZ family protein [Mycoplasma sp. 3686d]